MHFCRRRNERFPDLPHQKHEKFQRDADLQRYVYRSFSACSDDCLHWKHHSVRSEYSLREELHNEQELNDFAAHIAANIPENTYAFGIGVPEIYSILRWDTGCYTLDLADLSLRPEAGDYIMDDIKAKKIPAFLAGEGTISRLEKYSSREKSQWLLDTYEISREFEFKGAVLQYFTLK